MANTFILAKNYTELLDEVYKLSSVTADLTGDPAMARAGVNVNEICYPQIEVSGLGDYDRKSGYTNGSVNLQWKTTSFNYDRGTKISVDAMDDEMFALYLKYHFATCEREDLLGISSHVVDVFEKLEGK